MAFNIGDTYEWVKGPDTGKTDVIKTPSIRKGALSVIEFVSGRKCNVQIAKEYLSLITSAEEAGANKVEELIAVTDKPVKVKEIEQPTKSYTYRDLLDKIKNYEDIQTEITLDLNLPKLDTIRILIDAYGDEFKEELSEFMLEKVLTDTLKTQVTGIVSGWINNIENNKTLD